MAQRGAYMGSGHDENLCLEIINALIDQYKATLAPPALPPVPATSAAMPAPAVAPPPPPAPVPTALVPPASSAPPPPPPPQVGP